MNMVFKFIGKAYSGLVTGVANIITGGLEKVTGKTYGRTTAKEFREAPVGKVLTTAATATTLALGIVTLPKTLPFIAKAALKKPVAALVVGGLITTAGGRYLIEKSAEGIFVGGQALGEAAGIAKEKGEELDLGEALQIAGVAGLGIAAGAALPGIIEKVKEFADTAPEQLVKEKPVGVGGDIPITAPTETITTGELPKEKKAPAINVKIKIDNRSKSIGIKQSHRYLNQELVC